MGNIDEIPSHAASPPFSAKTGCRFTELKTYKKKNLHGLTKIHRPDYELCSHFCTVFLKILSTAWVRI